MAYGIVYCLIDITSDREYVGQTVKTAEKRFKEHAREEYYIGRAIRDIGAENFLIMILKECDSKAELDRWEKHFIKSRDTLAPNGYNLREGGEGGKLCAESIAKISATLTGRRGKKLPPRTPEWCAKQSEARRGKKLNLPTEAIINQAVAHRLPSPYKTLQNEIEKRALTYIEIAKALGLYRDTISKKMRGAQNFMPAQKLAIKNFLGVEMSVEELFKREN